MKVVISGASKGIGRATALLMAARGSDVCVCARTESALQSLKVEIDALEQSGACYYMVADVADKKQVQAFGAFALEKMGRVDVLVNNAGTFTPGSLFEEADGVLEATIQTNLFSAYHLSRALIPSMIQAGRGHIVNICSVASTDAYPNGGSYSVSKFALYGFSKNLRMELLPTGIKVSSILPGATLTDSWGGTDLPAERFIPADDIAKIIWQATTMSASTVVEDIVVRPMEGDI
jgi:short-subunit dehydrogenase